MTGDDCGRAHAYHVQNSGFLPQERISKACTVYYVPCRVKLRLPTQIHQYFGSHSIAFLNWVDYK